MKLIIININDALLERYENLTVDYDLRGDLIGDDVRQSIVYVEDVVVRQFPCSKKLADVEYDNKDYALGYMRGYNQALKDLKGEADE